MTVFYGNFDDDSITGTGSSDSIYGSYGDDTLYGGAGADFLYGNAGNDLLIADNDDIAHGGVFGGSGRDRLVVEGSIGINFNMKLHEIEEIVGSDGGNDSIHGTASVDNLLILGKGGDDTLAGGNGSDSISGGIGNDLLLGRDGNDVLSGGLGTDSLLGHAGDDTLEMDHDDVIGGNFDGGAGFDKVIILGNDGVKINLLIHGIEEVVGTNGNDYFFAPNATGNLIMDGQGGSDSLRGGLGNDSLAGGNGDDVLLGYEGDDTLVGGFGNDVMHGGDGNDVIYADHDDRFAERITGGAGYDILYLVGNSTFNIFIGASEFEEIHASDTGNDTIDANGGDDVSNKIWGLGGNDVIKGGRGDDTIYGGNGNDTIYGGVGNDHIYGEAGNDYFRYDKGEGADHYYFNGADKIGIRLYTSEDMQVTGLGGTGTDWQLTFNVQGHATSGDEIIIHFAEPIGFDAASIVFLP